MIKPIDKFTASIIRDGELYTTSFKKWGIQSYFQPIYSLMHQRMVGYEGLMRASKNGLFCSPLDLFKSCNNDEEVMHLDRLTRTLHLLNFNGAGELTRDKWIFLNVRAEVITSQKISAESFVQNLAHLGFSPHQIVIEILEDEITDVNVLAEFVESFKQAGFLVAIDDFGAGHSNFDRIWKISPNIVKLDRGMIQSAVKEKRARRIFSRLVNLIRETESLVLIEGVESEDEALLAMDTEADMVQGYYFAKPNVLSEACEKSQQQTFAKLNKGLKVVKKQHQALYQQRIESFERVIGKAANLVQMGMPFNDSCQGILGQTGCCRVYMLNEDGYQVTQTLESGLSPRHYQPFEQGQGANWGRREYFTNAISALGKMYISESYLSLPDAKMNVTFSLAFYSQGHKFVLCCDIDLTTLESGFAKPANGEMLLPA